jgi:hypothetical protein
MSHEFRIKLINFTPILLTLALAMLPGCSTPSFEEAEAERRQERMERDQERVRVALDQRDVTLGMKMRDVLNVWGEPGEIEAAGQSDSHQRWIYFTGLSSSWSLGSARAVYFENGRVIGWETLSR